MTQPLLDGVEIITAAGELLACVIRAGVRPESTTFLTPGELKQQVGLLVHPAGSEIARHRHRPLERRIVGSSEVLVVRSGRCEVDLYDDADEVVATCRLGPGDAMLIAAGGHGFRILEETVLLEIKQGPYAGADDKEPF